MIYKFQPGGAVLSADDPRVIALKKRQAALAESAALSEEDPRVVALKKRQAALAAQSGGGADEILAKTSYLDRTPIEIPEAQIPMLTVDAPAPINDVVVDLTPLQQDEEVKEVIKQEPVLTTRNPGRRSGSGRHSGRSGSRGGGRSGSTSGSGGGSTTSAGRSRSGHMQVVEPQDKTRVAQQPVARVGQSSVVGTGQRAQALPNGAVIGADGKYYAPGTYPYPVIGGPFSYTPYKPKAVITQGRR